MKTKIVFIHKIIILAGVGGMVIPAQLCLAEMVYFKNGRKIEGYVERSDQGIWVEGVLFKQDEIERIEKTAPKAKVDKNQQKPWYAPFLTKMGLTAGRADAKGSPPSQQKTPVPNPAVQNVPASLPQQGTVPQQGAAPFVTFDSRNFGQIMAEAQRLQNEAHERQVQMMQEIQRAEEDAYGYGDGSYDPQNYQKDYDQRQNYPSYDDQRRAYPQERDNHYSQDGYDDEREKKSKKRFKSIKVDKYGDVSWE